MELNLQRVYRKEEVNQASSAIVERLLEEESSTSALARVFVLGKVLSEAEAALRARAIEHIDGKKEVQFGVEMSLVNTKREYDYSECNDSLLAALQKEQEEAERVLSACKERVKARKKFLEGLPKPVADTETGEVINPAKLITSGQTIKVEFQKGS